MKRSSPDFINNKKKADTTSLSTLLSSLVRQTSLIMDAAGGDESLIATMLTLQGKCDIKNCPTPLYLLNFGGFLCVGGFGRLLVNLNQGKKEVHYQYELSDKSAEDVVSAWAAVEKKGIFFWCKVVAGLFLMLVL
jgi:hypothetical protein